MIIRNMLRDIYYKKIKKMSSMDFRIFHLRRVGMNIGKNCSIFSDELETNESYLVTIGNNVIISPKVILLTHDASASHYLPGASDLFGRVNIGNNVFVGFGTILLPGVSIADDCIIGAGSVVTKSCRKKGMVIAGNPAKEICTIKELRQKNTKYALNVWKQTDRRRYLEENEERFIKR